MSENGKKIHNVILEQRRRLNMSGVNEVIGFDDETITLDTELGMLTIKGEGLKIGSFSASSKPVSRIRSKSLSTT